jgi:DNA-binding transcriptional regulator YbjK
MNDEEDGRLARGAARRTLVLDAAVRVVASRGSTALTHRAAAAEAKVSIASVSYHFPSISELRRETLQYAGSSIGFELVDLVRSVSSSIDETPEVCSAFAVRLVSDRRIETAAVFELIVAAGHDPDLRPIVAFFNGQLAVVLTPYLGERIRALAVAAALQGLVLTHLATSTSAANEAHGLGDAVADLIRRYRSAEPQNDGQDRPRHPSVS